MHTKMIFLSLNKYIQENILISVERDEQRLNLHCDAVEHMVKFSVYSNSFNSIVFNLILHNC
jgi:hypothetical protein